MNTQRPAVGGPAQQHGHAKRSLVAQLRQGDWRESGAKAVRGRDFRIASERFATTGALAASPCTAVKIGTSSILSSTHQHPPVVPAHG